MHSPRVRQLISTSIEPRFGGVLCIHECRLLADSNGMDSSSPYGIYVPDWSSCSQSQEKKESTMNISRRVIDLATRQTLILAI